MGKHCHVEIKHGQFNHTTSLLIQHKWVENNFKKIEKEKRRGKGFCPLQYHYIVGLNACIFSIHLTKWVSTHCVWTSTCEQVTLMGSNQFIGSISFTRTRLRMRRAPMVFLGKQYQMFISCMKAPVFLYKKNYNSRRFWLNTHPQWCSIYVCSNWTMIRWILGSIDCH